MKRLVLAAAAALACQGAAAAPALAGHGAGAAPPSIPVKGKVIYSQNGIDSGISIVSQQFESSFEIYDSMAADDFTVTKATIVEVDVVGKYFSGSGPATSVNIVFYKDSNGLPGKALKVYADAAITADNDGSFAIAVPKTVVKNTVWVSVQANLDFSVGGEWGWESQTQTSGHPAAWQNPGGGFGVGCATWTTETSCIADGQGDHMFTLIGKGK